MSDNDLIAQLREARDHILRQLGDVQWMGIGFFHEHANAPLLSRLQEIEECLRNLEPDSASRYIVYEAHSPSI